MPCQRPDHQPHPWDCPEPIPGSPVSDIRRWARRCLVPEGSEEYQFAGTIIARMTHRDEFPKAARALATAAHIVRERGSGKWSSLETLDMVATAYDNHLLSVGRGDGPDAAATAFFAKFVDVHTTERAALLSALSVSGAHERMTPWRYAALCDPDFSESSTAWVEVVGQARHLAAQDYVGDDLQKNGVEVMELTIPTLGFMVMKFYD